MPHYFCQHHCEPGRSVSSAGRSRSQHAGLFALVFCVCQLLRNEAPYYVGTKPPGPHIVRSYYPLLHSCGGISLPTHR